MTDLVTSLSRRVAAAALLVSIFAGQVTAQSPSQTRMPVDRVVEALATMGFEVEHISRTWLGRIRIEASNGSVTRELIVNRVTGEVLRDYWEDDDDHEDESDDGHDDDNDDDDHDSDGDQSDEDDD